MQSCVEIISITENTLDFDNGGFQRRRTIGLGLRLPWGNVKRSDGFSPEIEGAKQFRRHIEYSNETKKIQERRKVCIWKTGLIAARHAKPFKFNPNASPRVPARAAMSALGVKTQKVQRTLVALDLET